MYKENRLGYLAQISKKVILTYLKTLRQLTSHYSLRNSKIRNEKHKQKLNKK